MAEGDESGSGFVLGDPVPWFRAQNLSGERVDLHVSAGRWVVLAFLGPLAEAHTQERLARLANRAAACSEDRLMIYALSATPPSDAAELVRMSRPNLKFLGDYDGAIGAYYGAYHRQRTARPVGYESPRTVVLDAMLRAVANIPCEPARRNEEQHDELVERFLRDLPPIDDSAGVPLTAPVLMVPRVFDFSLCEHLIGLFDKIGGADSGFLVERGGQPATVTDHARKSRRDLVLTAPELCGMIRRRIVARLLPAIELYFQFRATHMDRYMVACYDSASGGHFLRHRDNMTAGVEHRRFAVSVNLNGGYDGCDLVFPEFGRRSYRAPTGGALVFSCGALHEVTPITKGKRYAFLPFLYGEADVKKSLENNALLQGIGVDYRAEEHRLLQNRPTHHEGR
jgi:predicted 2-oxoglutarate/Fe(II)-dependent dioxygenase YbiX/peroxiredoxin